jgi:acyl transferase domain-containing protein
VTAIGSTVIRGIGLSNDVAGSLLSPESEGQLRAMRAAYAQAGWRPDDVDLIEGHGTGTPRGDAVELASLTALWDGSLPRAGLCARVGEEQRRAPADGGGRRRAVQGAVGVRGGASSHRRQHATSPRPAMRVRGGPFRVLSSAEPWARRKDGVPRRAALSAFGFGGINAHLLLEEHLPDVPLPARASVVAAEESLVAIVGMAAHVGRLDSLARFELAVLRGDVQSDELPPERWHGLDHGLTSSTLSRLRTISAAPSSSPSRSPPVASSSPPMM